MMVKYIGTILVGLCIITLHCNEWSKASIQSQESVPASEPHLPLDRIQLPDGFKIDYYATNVENARSLVVSPTGTVFVGTRNEDKVYALRDVDGDHKADEKYIIASRLKMPNGVALKEGNLYVSALERILKFPNVEADLAHPPAPEVIFDQFPTEEWHGKKFIAFGPDGKLYAPVGAPCNICEPDQDIFTSMTRMNDDGSGLEIFARGIRETVGFDWHPETGELWFTENGRDYLGDHQPPDELNYAPQPGLHFGYPYCHGGDIADPEHGQKHPCSDFTPPAQKLGAHVAPLGMRFYTGSMFPSEYQNQIFIPEHGSWNRSRMVGYRIMLVRLDGSRPVSYEPFATGWLHEEKQEPWGRPTAIAQMTDGSLFVSDDYANVIYRISYSK